jgi:tetratricopeptide (TPR) repeat protein
MGRFKDGIEKYRAALKLTPHEPKILFNLGYAKEKIGDIEDAIFYYQRALDYAPDFEKATRRLEALKAVRPA